MQEALALLSPPAPQSGTRGVELFHSIIRQEHSRQLERGIQYPEVEIRKVWKEVLAALNNEGLYGGAITTESIERIGVEYECLVNPVWPMPGLKDILEKLAERLHLGIVSNAQFHTPLLFPALLGDSHDHLGFEEDLCFWSYRCLQAKPSAALFIALKNSLEKSYNILPAETLYVGNDLLNDILPAAELGFRTALFAGDSRSLNLREDDPRTVNTEADIIITSLAQLRSVIAIA
jgi:putative hydrolase of the HAD superfamily